MTTQTNSLNYWPQGSRSNGLLCTPGRHNLLKITAWGRLLDRLAYKVRCIVSR
jgi:hypothetical protein